MRGCCCILTPPTGISCNVSAASVGTEPAGDVVCGVICRMGIILRASAYDGGGSSVSGMIGVYGTLLPEITDIFVWDGDRASDGCSRETAYDGGPSEVTGIIVGNEVLLLGGDSGGETVGVGGRELGGEESCGIVVTVTVVVSRGVVVVTGVGDVWLLFAAGCLLCGAYKHTMAMKQPTKISPVYAIGFEFVVPKTHT